MSNVVKFPVERKIENIANEIISLQNDLTEKFDSLTNLYITARDIERSCMELQVRYDDLVMQYAAAIGTENIPTGMLEYCTNAIANCDGDTGEISITLEHAPPADEITANKTEEDPLAELRQFMETINKFMKGKLDELQ